MRGLSSDVLDIWLILFRYIAYVMPVPVVLLSSKISVCYQEFLSGYCHRYFRMLWISPVASHELCALLSFGCSAPRHIGFCALSRQGVRFAICHFPHSVFIRLIVLDYSTYSKTVFRQCDQARGRLSFSIFFFDLPHTRTRQTGNIGR